jgi:hypothetical protein
MSQHALSYGEKLLVPLLNPQAEEPHLISRPRLLNEIRNSYDVIEDQ